MTQRPPPSRPGRPGVPDHSSYRPHEAHVPGNASTLDQRYHASLRDPRAGGPPRRPQRRRRSGLRLLAWGVSGLGVLIAASLVLLLWLAPVGLIRDQLVQEVKARTGRDLVVAGRTSLSLYPSPAVAMGDVLLSAPPGMGGAPFVSMRRLEARVPLLPLL